MVDIPDLLLLLIFFFKHYSFAVNGPFCPSVGFE